MLRDALVVGINTYHKLPSLKAPAQDAESVARCLEGFGEFRVFRLPEAIQSHKPAISAQAGVTTRQLEEALIQLFKPSGKSFAQTAIFYYSGHGLQRNAGVREGYLATSDANPDQGNYGLSLFWLRRLLQESPVRQRIIILDCCHSGELLNFLEADPGAQQGTDRLFMAASREYEAAYESLDSHHSVFTQALLAGLNPYKAKGGVINSHYLTDVVSRALKGEIQQPLFESSGSEIILTRAVGAAAAVQMSKSTILERLKQLSYGFCPFRGLQPFEEAHADYFFGREKFTDQLTEYVRKSKFCAVIGPSATGKTSVLQAGLIHQLHQATATGQSQTYWDIRSITLGSNPLHQLAEAFVDAKAQGIERADQLRRAETFLQEGGNGLAQLIRASVNGGSNGSTVIQNRRIVLVLDQFEAILLNPPTPEAAQQVNALINCLTEVLQHEHLPLHIVIGLRTDGLAPLHSYGDFYAWVTEHMLVVPPLSYEEIKSTIVNPLNKMGLRYDSNLIYSLLLDVVGSPGELPLLQLTLQELWRQREIDPSGQEAPKLTLEVYANLGGIRQILAQRATACFEALTDAEQALAKRIFLSLCELGEGTEDTRRRASLSELITPNTCPIKLAQTIEKLVKANLIVMDLENPDQQAAMGSGMMCSAAAWKTSAAKQNQEFSVTALLQATSSQESACVLSSACLDIVHESLIRSWPLMRSWLQDNRQAIYWQRRLEASAKEWQQQGCPSHLDYLLTGKRLQEACAFQAQTQGLSTLALDYLATSRRVVQRQRRQHQMMRLLIPVSMSAGMLVSYGQTALMNHGDTFKGLSAHVMDWLNPTVTQPPAASSLDLLENPEQANPFTPSATTEDTLSGDLTLEAEEVPFVLPPLSAPKQLSTGQPLQPYSLTEPAYSQGLMASSPATLTQSVEALSPLGKLMGQWTSPADPNLMVQVWCVQAQHVPQCFAAFLPTPRNAP